MEAWKTEKSEQVLDTPWVRVRKDTVSLPNGKRMDDFYAVTIRDAAAIVALDEEGNVLLKREYRHCYGRELIEIPGNELPPCGGPTPGCHGDSHRGGRAAKKSRGHGDDE